MPELGRIALVICLGLSVYAVIAGAYAAATGRRRLALSARNALVACLGATLVAATVLLVALIGSDFSFVYVADHTSLELPTPYKVSAFWGGQEGSLLLWLLILTAYSTAAVLLARRTGGTLVAWVVPVLGVVVAFFSLVLVAVSSPFATQAAPPDGIGLNPSLQNPYMVSHPPALYLGYVGLAVPFAFGMAALLSRRTDELWIVLTRRWTLAAWTFLGIGQLLGAHWAYVEVGWGGYFAWDPVENAALMPWLAATAFLHSVMIQEKRGMLKVWNMLLVIGAFCLSLFGTFLTRSGILNSIHSFTEGPLGAWFLGFICLVVVGSTALVLARLPLLRAKTRLESPVSREATFLYNNLLLVALCLTILWGVVYPILSEAVRGEQMTVGPPYYNFFLKAFGLPLLLLMGIGPLVAWRRASVRSLGAHVRLAGGDRSARRRGAASTRGRRLDPGPRCILVLRVRPRLDRARVRAWNARAPRDLRRAVADGIRLADLAEPAPLRRLRRPCGDRPARDRGGRFERVRHDPRGTAETRRDDGRRCVHTEVRPARDP